MMNSYHDSSTSLDRSKETLISPNLRCIHCGKYYCQIDFIFSSLSTQGNFPDQQYILDQRIQEILSK